jgi:heat shock protein HslJ
MTSRVEPDGRLGRLAAMYVAPVRAVVVAMCLVVASAVAACGPAGEPSLSRSAWPATLTGTTWTAIRVDNLATVAGSQPTAAFAAEELQGSTGCNGYFGSYQYAAGVIKIGQIGSTAMACLDGAINATEQRYMAAMQGASSVSIDPAGRMIFDGSGGSITFEVAPQPAG